MIDIPVLISVVIITVGFFTMLGMIKHKFLSDYIGEEGLAK